MESWKPGDSDSPVRPCADGQGVWYRLPHLPSHSQEEKDELVLAIDEAEEHISKLKFILFLRDIQAQWPKGVAAVGIQYDNSDDAPFWRVRCWKKSRKPANPNPFPGTSSVPADPVVPGMELVLAPAEFRWFIAHHAAQDDKESFPLLASLHLGGEPAPWTKDQFAALEMDVLEPATRSRLLAARADKALPPASASRPSGPGRL